MGSLGLWLAWVVWVCGWHGRRGLVSLWVLRVYKILAKLKKMTWVASVAWIHKDWCGPKKMVLVENLSHETHTTYATHAFAANHKFQIT